MVSLSLTQLEMTACLQTVLELALAFLKSESHHTMPIFSVVFLKPAQQKVVGVSVPPLSREEFDQWIHKLVARRKIVGFCLVASGRAVPNTDEMTRLRTSLWMQEHGTLENYPSAFENLIGYASAPGIEILKSIVIIRDDAGSVIEYKELKGAALGSQADLKALKVDWT